MNKTEILKGIYSTIDKMRDSISYNESLAKDILEPLFRDQRRIAWEVQGESEFEYTRKWWRSPVYEFTTNATPQGVYYESGASFWELNEYNDGDSADSTRLLPIFLTDASEEAKKEVIREGFRARIQREASTDAASRQKKIEDAIKVLKENGVSV